MNKVTQKTATKETESPRRPRDFFHWPAVSSLYCSESHPLNTLDHFLSVEALAWPLMLLGPSRMAICPSLLALSPHLLPHHQSVPEVQILWQGPRGPGVLCVPLLAHHPTACTHPHSCVLAAPTCTGKPRLGLPQPSATSLRTQHNPPWFWAPRDSGFCFVIMSRLISLLPWTPASWRPRLPLIIL